MQTVYFHLSLTAEQIRSYYEGVVRQVVVRASDGRRVQFPAQWLRRFVTLEGVHGLFEMRFGDDHKLIDFRRVGD